MPQREDLKGAPGGAVGAAVKQERKRAREELALDLSDFHPSKGWLRADAPGTLVALRAETEASRLLVRGQSSEIDKRPHTFW